MCFLFLGPKSNPPRSLTDLNITQETARLIMLATPRPGPLVPLLLVTLCSAPTVLAGEGSGAQMWDDCDYSDGNTWRCGSVCLTSSLDTCVCGNTTLRYEFPLSQYCCTSAQCTKTVAGRRTTASCPRGQVLDISQQCNNNTCYSDYQTSQQFELS